MRESHETFHTICASMLLKISLYYFREMVTLKFNSQKTCTSDSWFCNFIASILIYTPCLKNSQNCFHQNFVKFPPTLIIFGTQMAKTIEFCKVHSFSTSPNLCQRTTA